MKRENLKKLLLSFSEEDYKSKVNLHIHTNMSDGKMTPLEVINQAKEKGKEYISITDHNTIEAYLSTNISAENMTISGVEFDCLHKGVIIHIIGYGIDIDNKTIKSLFAKNIWGCKSKIYRLFHLRNPKDVIEKIKQAGGIPVLAHSACYWCSNLDEFVKSLVDMGLEGLEVYYPYKGARCIFKFHSRKTVNKIAEKYNLIKTGGEDNHGRKL